MAENDDLPAVNDRGSSLNLEIREERSEDVAAIRRLHEAAFPTRAEAALIDALRADDAIVASVVAADVEIVGSAVFSTVSIRAAGGTVKAAALAPVAVRPERQRQGIGTRIIDAGLGLCRERNLTIAFVLGDPTYYARFGFSVDLTRGLKSVYSGPNWMALELSPNALRDVAGLVTYPGAFANVS
jgi:putative acetyltransferase